jgi:hypothetical protein
MADMRSPAVAPTGHDLHDPFLVARHAAGEDLPGDERADAIALLADCAACRELAADLGAISRAVATEPVRARSRDFRLTAEQARRLRGSWLDRLLARFALPDLPVLRPLAGSALALGLLLVAVGTVVPPGVATVPEPAVMMERAAEDAAQPVPDEPSMRESEAGVSEDTDAMLESQAADPAEPMLESQAADPAEPMLESQADPAEETGADAFSAGAEEVVVEGAPEDAEMMAQAAPEAADEGPDAVAEDAVIEEAAAEDTLAVSAPGEPRAQADDRAVIVGMGALLALGGGILVVAILLARRREDPLLR